MGGATEGYQGESPLGSGVKDRHPNGGGGGGGGSSDSGGGGGGYATAGGIGAHPDVSHQGEGGLTYGFPELTELPRGSGGGSSGSDSSGGKGGAGGGAIRIMASEIEVTGRLSADGEGGGSDGQPGNLRGGGGGSGGSILLRADTIDLAGGVVRAKGGAGGYGIHDNDPNRMANGGNGGDGRIRLEPGSVLTGLTDPPASVESVTFLSVAGPAGPVIEGTDAVFAVSVANPIGQAVSVDYVTADAAAVSGEDYVAASGTLTFPPEGPFTVEVRVPVAADETGEPDEAFLIGLVSPTGAFLLPGQDTAGATILNQLPPSTTTFGPDTPSPTLLADVLFAATFSEPVSGFAAEDLSLSGTATDCVLSEPVPATAIPTSEWSIGLTGCSPGTVALVLAAEAVTDTTGALGPIRCIAVFAPRHRPHGTGGRHVRPPEHLGHWLVRH